jgi:NAD-specific glutamate dehydrogenase
VRRELSITLLKRKTRKKPVEVFNAWVEENQVAVRKLDAIIAEMKLRPEVDFATLSVAAQELRRLTNS